MTSKERILAALKHTQPDRVPVDFGGTATSGIHVTCVAALREHFGLEKRPVKVHEPYQLLGWIDDDLADAMGIDVAGVPAAKTMFGFANENWKPWRTQDGLDVLVSEHFVTTTDANGDTLIYPEGDASAPPSGRMPKGGFYFDTIVRQEPIDEDKLDPRDNLEEFGPIRDEDLAYFKEAVDRAVASGRAVAATFGGTAFGDIALVPGPFLKHPKGIRDIAEWYMSTAIRQDYIHKVFDRQCEIALENLAKIHNVVGNAVDVVFICGTDFGTQSSTFCSVDTYRELYLPYYKRVNDWIHEHTTWKTFKHSCGAIESFVDGFIEAGFDILNPVQCSAAGMDPQHLKDAYGDRITFWGGGIDTQKVLPFGTPAEVREQVLQRCEIFAKGGGFVFNTIHNIQPKTPTENLVAMLEALREFNGK
ncbi:MAG: methyltransferase [Phycisphaerae bacterium]|nr:methyltransferase [Phycisphaerae bacterium]